ncbi:MAG: NAD(P)-binding domain-containing protein [Acidimicrobiales bacterium]
MGPSQLNATPRGPSGAGSGAGGKQTTVVIIGGGHSGLAMSKCLSDRSVDHVVLERGQIAHSWKTERWDSLRLLTPNWQSTLPGYEYSGDEPDEYMAMPELIEFIETYASVVDAPVQTETEVTSVSYGDGRYRVETTQGPWMCEVAVLASGACNVASTPDFADCVPDDIVGVNPIEYRNPEQLVEGGVMVVGASATGLQLAEEIHRSGRPVTVSVGEHVRLPRVYRGHDIQWWMDRTGRLDERWDDIDDITRARGVPSPQLVGTPEHSTLDLNALTSQGVRLRGRIGMVRDGVAMFSGGLKNTCSLADLKMNRLLALIDEWATENDYDGTVPDSEEFERTLVSDDVPLTMDLGSGEIKTIVWATGFKPDYSWLDVPVINYRGRLNHDGGVVESPGMYLIGTPFLRRRKSSFIHGASDDANDLSDHIVEYLTSKSTRPTG